MGRLAINGSSYSFFVLDCDAEFIGSEIVAKIFADVKKRSPGIVSLIFHNGRKPAVFLTKNFDTRSINNEQVGRALQALRWETDSGWVGWFRGRGMGEVTVEKPAVNKKKNGPDLPAYLPHKGTVFKMSSSSPLPPPASASLTTSISNFFTRSSSETGGTSTDQSSR